MEGQSVPIFTAAVGGIGAFLLSWFLPTLFPEIPRWVVKSGVFTGIVLMLFSFCLPFLPEWATKPSLLRLIVAVFGFITIGIGVIGVHDQKIRGIGGKELVSAAPPKPKPELRLSLLGGNIFIPDSDKSLTGIALDVTIVNTGAPSAAITWSLMVIPEGLNPVIAQWTKIGTVLTLKGVAGRKIRAADALNTKAMAPIGTTPIQGVLLFYAPMGKDVVVKPTTRLDLSVTDIYNNKSTASQVMGEWLSR